MISIVKKSTLHLFVYVCKFMCSIHLSCILNIYNISIKSFNKFEKSIKISIIRKSLNKFPHQYVVLVKFELACRRHAKIEWQAVITRRTDLVIAPEATENERRAHQQCGEDVPDSAESEDAVGAKDGPDKCVLLSVVVKCKLSSK